MITLKRIPMIDGLSIEDAHKGGKGGSSGPSAAEIAKNEAAEKAAWELDTAEMDYQNSLSDYNKAYDSGASAREIKSRTGTAGLINTGNSKDLATYKGGDETAHKQNIADFGSISRKGGVAGFEAATKSLQGLSAGMNANERSTEVKGDKKSFTRKKSTGTGTEEDFGLGIG